MSKQLHGTVNNFRRKTKNKYPSLTLEAMKMETTITAPRDLKISRIALSEATMVEADDLVVEAE